MRTSMDDLQRLFKAPSYGLHRAQLHGILLGAVSGAVLRTGCRVTEVIPGPERARVVVAGPEGAEALEADLVVVADGVHSRSRQALFPEHPGAAYVGYWAWRGLVPRRMPSASASAAPGPRPGGRIAVSASLPSRVGRCRGTRRSSGLGARTAGRASTRSPSAIGMGGADLAGARADAGVDRAVPRHLLPRGPAPESGSRSGRPGRVRRGGHDPRPGAGWVPGVGGRRDTRGGRRVRAVSP